MFFGPLDNQNKHKIVKRYMRNDFAPVVIAEVAKDLAPRVVYTLLQRGDNPVHQRVFLLGGLNSRTRQISDEVFEVNLQAQKTAGGASLVRKNKMP